MTSGTSRVVVVNGGARGIGAAICEVFARRGDRVAVLDVDEAAAKETADRLGATAVACDIADEAAVEAAFATVQDAVGAPDVLVNNAGINPRQAPMDVELEVWNRVLAVNLTGYFLCARAAGVRMAETGGGAIVNISSIAGTRALGRGNLAYAVTKGGIDALTRELAIEWASRGIRVNAVAPCQVATEGFLANEQAGIAAHDRAASDYRRGIPLGRAAGPLDIAHAVEYLASDAAAMVTGVVLPVDGGNLAMNAGATLG